MGVLQALEAIKLLAAGIFQEPSNAATPSMGIDTKINVDKEDHIDQKPPQPKAEPPTLLLFSAITSSPFRSIRLRSRRSTCAACSTQASITPESLTSGSLDYAQFCGMLNPIDVLKPEDRISATQYAQWVRQQQQQKAAVAEQRDDKNSAREHILVDVREPTQFALCSLPGSVNIPISELVSPQGLPVADGKGDGEGYAGLTGLDEESDVVVVCRFGNDSQLAVQRLRKMGVGKGRKVMDIKGGLRAWREEVDEGFPEY